MDKTVETPPEIPQADAEDQNTPPPRNQENHLKSQNPIAASGKNGVPDRLMVPKAFKFTERYTSPTDRMMSPVSRGILARNRKGRKLLPPSVNQPNLQAIQVEELTPFPQIENC